MSIFVVLRFFNWLGLHFLYSSTVNSVLFFFSAGRESRSIFSIVLLNNINKRNGDFKLINNICSHIIGKYLPSN